jgi:phosphatidylserine decarboxylase precursor
MRDIVADLRRLLRARPQWKQLLLDSIRDAEVEGLKSLSDYYTYLYAAVRYIPRDRDCFQKLCEFYWILDQPSGRELQKQRAFNRWMVEFARQWGSFLDTVESARHIDSFMKDLSFHMDEFQPMPSGWLTFNQFFARQVKPGQRPIDSPCNDKVIVSPADSVFVGQWPISEHSTITAKSMVFKIVDLLEGSPFKDKFAGGTFMHAFLNVNDYHRYHVPVAGHVREVRDIPGNVYLDVYRKKDGSFDARDGTGYQFTQARGLVVQENPLLGFVATLPIGMAQVSSCVLTPDVDSELAKGEEMGYFQFGGSDIIVLFEAGKVNIGAQPNVHYKQGTWIGEAA